MNKNNSQIIQQLKQASAGLLWLSESDYPFKVFLWQGMAPATPEGLLQQTNHSPDTPLKIVEFDDFFYRIITETEDDWDDEEEEEQGKKFKILVQILKSNLVNLQVYRLGEIEIDVYIVGETPTGDLAGLSTISVET
ncbi:MAG: nuclease A inhibitor family protein [Nostocaceae cyanobacterium]|nr:nuclease A inhibitor family protein [Nostocaceae cyanobacterium]